MSRWLVHREHSRCPCSLPFCRPGKPPRCPRYHHAAIWSRHLSLYWSQGFSTWSNRLRQEIALFPTEKASRLREGNRVELRCSTGAVGRRAREQPGRQAVAHRGRALWRWRGWHFVHCPDYKTRLLTFVLIQHSCFCSNKIWICCVFPYRETVCVCVCVCVCRRCKPQLWLEKIERAEFIFQVIQITV